MTRYINEGYARYGKARTSMMPIYSPLSSLLNAVVVAVVMLLSASGNTGPC